MKLSSLAISIALSVGATLSGFGQGTGQATPPGSGVVIPEGTIIQAELKKGLDANKAKVGDPVKLEVMLDVRDRVTGVLLIPKKAELSARVSYVDFPENNERTVRICEPDCIDYAGAVVVWIEIIRAEWEGGSAELHGRITSVQADITTYLAPGRDGTLIRRPDSMFLVSDGKLVFPTPNRFLRSLPAGSVFSIEHRVPSEATKAFESSRDAALKGEAEAQFRVGLMYHGGKGVAQDYAQAAEWYRKGAEQGHAKAQNNLAVLYAQGQGVPQDYVAAYMWFTVAAAARPDKNPANLQLLESRMAPEQIAEGKRRAEEWLKQHPPSH